MLNSVNLINREFIAGSFCWTERYQEMNTRDSKSDWISRIHMNPSAAQVHLFCRTLYSQSMCSALYPPNSANFFHGVFRLGYWKVVPTFYSSPFHVANHVSRISFQLICYTTQQLTKGTSKMMYHWEGITYITRSVLPAITITLSFLSPSFFQSSLLSAVKPMDAFWSELTKEYVNPGWLLTCHCTTDPMVTSGRDRDRGGLSSLNSSLVAASAFWDLRTTDWRRRWGKIPEYMNLFFQVKWRGLINPAGASKTRPFTRLGKLLAKSAQIPPPREYPIKLNPSGVQLSGDDVIARSISVA